MRKEISRKNSFRLSMVFMLILAAALTISGCSSDNYDEPTATQTDSPLISAATLRGWINQGLVNNEEDWEKVVILDYGTTSTALRIPGACRVATSDLRAFRLEGVADAAAMVASGGQMDSVIQALGIDENTTIVFTTGNSNFYSTRAYWTFRYWGFPKERLKLLDGGNAAWTAAGYATTYNAPAVTASTYSVTNIGVLCDDLRASLGEMITMVQSGANGDTALTIDARGDVGYNGGKKTEGYYDLLEDGTVSWVVFEGHPTDGQYLGGGSLYEADGTFKSASAIRTLFEEIGGGGVWDSSMTVYPYCTSGYGASQIFFVLDALLDAPVLLYDGAFSQWGQMATIDTNGDTDGNADGIGDIYGGMLPSGSNWATDVLTDTAGAVGSGPTYNVDNGVLVDDIEQLRLTQGNIDLSANQIEDEDTEYIQGEAGGAPTPGGGDSGGGC